MNLRVKDPSGRATNARLTSWRSQKKIVKRIAVKYTTTTSSLIGCPQINLNCYSCWDRWRARLRSINSCSWSRAALSVGIHWFSIFQVLCGGELSAHMRRYHQVWLSTADIEAIGSGPTWVRCPYDGSSMEALQLTAIKRRCYPVLQSGWWGYWEHSCASAAAVRLSVYLGYQRQVPVDSERDGEKVGLQSNRLD